MSEMEPCCAVGVMCAGCNVWLFSCMHALGMGTRVSSTCSTSGHQAALPLRLPAQAALLH